MEPRILPIEEWGKLKDIYDADDCPLPTPGKAFIIVVEDGSGIVGHVVVHTLNFLGLMHVDESHRNNGVGAMLARAVDHIFIQSPGESLFTVTANETAKHLAAGFEMVEIPGTLYRKDY